jgi:hypothetical protein
LEKDIRAMAEEFAKRRSTRKISFPHQEASDFMHLDQDSSKANDNATWLQDSLDSFKKRSSEQS